MKNIFRRVSKREGFTLIEIMIVILIIAVILTIAVPSWIGARERSHTRSCISQLEKIRYAKEAWAMDNKKGGADVPSMDQVMEYLKNTPTCPAGGTYTIGAVNTDPTCSRGGDHVL